jgi:hypothetical protein
VDLSLFQIVLHLSRSCHLRLQFLTPIFFRSSSTDPSQLNLGFPTRRVISGLRRVSSFARIQFLHSKEVSQPPHCSYCYVDYVQFTIQRVKLIIVSCSMAETCELIFFAYSILASPRNGFFLRMIFLMRRV